MTTRELLEYELGQVGKQIEGCIRGMSESAFDTACAPGGMTPRDMLEHLCEAYQAYITVSGGGKHEWGAFKIADRSTENVVRTFKDLRATAASIALGRDDDEGQREAYDYIVGHDNYHVGQLALARMQADSEWNPYSLYE